MLEVMYDYYSLIYKSNHKHLVITPKGVTMVMKKTKRWSRIIGALRLYQLLITCIIVKKDIKAY
jgi:hypothetical protein